MRAVLIRGFIRWYDVDLGDCERPNPADYRHFNEFFTRPLHRDARPVDATSDGVASPCDGRVLSRGTVEGDTLVQAKGYAFPIQDLLADATLGRRLAGGDALTIYLAPRDYHRVHAPCSLRFAALRRTGTARFRVDPETAAAIPGLYIANERAVFEFDANGAAVALVMVAAVGVGNISTLWDRGALADAPNTVAKGDEIGRFNLGSTVIVVAERGFLNWREDLDAGQTVRCGERIGQLAGQT